MHRLDELCLELAQHDPSDVLAAVGALQLVPANAGSCLRLETLAHLAATLHPGPGRPTIPSVKLRALCNDTLLGNGLFLEMEDPFDNPFTAAFTFYGGSYTIFLRVDDE